MDTESYDRRVVLKGDLAAVAVVRVMHPCRCDAPDPEATRMEPLDVPVATLLSDTHYLAVCSECEYRLLVVAPS